MDIFKKIAPFFIILILSIPAIWPLLQHGYFPMHDDTQPTRIYEMYHALRDGQFPVRWVDDLGYGYGYPIFNFYSPLPYYIGAAGMYLGLDVIAATKLMFGIGIFLSGLSMCWLLSVWRGRNAGILAALLYIYFPYHATQLFVRGAAGELWAYALLPLAPSVMLLKKTTPLHLVISGIGIAGVILSHNITGFILVGLLAVYLSVQVLLIIINKSRETALYFVFVALIIGLMLSAWFWIPAIAEMHYTRAYTLVEGTNNFRDHFVYPDQLWNSAWGYAGSAPGRLDGMSFEIGKFHLLLGFLGIGCMWYVSKKSKTQNKSHVAWWLVGGLGISIFMMLPQSQFVWELLPPLEFVQYPWRFLVFVGFFIAVVSITIFDLFKKKLHRILLLVFATGIVIALNLKYFRPRYLSPHDPAQYTNEQKAIWDISKISDEYLPRDFPIPSKREETRQSKVSNSSDIIIEASEYRSHFAKITVSSPAGGEMIFNQANFPGWHASINDKKTIVETNAGKIAVVVPPGTHLVSFYFTDTAIRRLANFVSILGVGIVVFILLTQRKNELD